MIVCTLNGKMAYPSSSDKIKVTYENQYVKDSGSYTYDITFPMDIAANRKIFGNVQRIDVKRLLPTSRRADCMPATVSLCRARAPSLPSLRRK